MPIEPIQLTVSVAAAYSNRMKKRMLPIGMTSLRKIQREDCYYVDKTDLLRRLVEGGQHYFLSRPRRFGKTLLVDTLQELFEGSEELFRGLAVHGKWDWSARHPVVRLDFGGGDFGDPDGVREEAESQLKAAERLAGIEPGSARVSIRFRELIAALHERTGQRAVVLVDEYDKPILDALGDRELALANRDFLRSLYGTIKACDRHLRFVFLTGVSKFSQAGIFSGLNNLNDITLDERYGALCGYTDAELDAVFAPELEGLDREEVRRWYNGYNWLGPERVYNPHDILLLFDKRRFRPYWFQTGTPTFLADLLARRRVAAPALEGLVAGHSLLSAIDVDRIPVEALLFQTGYLTVVGEERDEDTRLYQLDYPNQEVRRSLNALLLKAMAPEVTVAAESRELRRLMRANDFAGLENLFRAFLASIPNEWYANTGMAGYEAHYASVFYSHFVAAGMDVRAEESTARGRSDLTVLYGGVYLFEFKVADGKPEGRALAQIRERGYADKYRRPGVQVHLIGIEFGREERNIVGFEFETV